jgi:mxaA protein
LRVLLPVAAALFFQCQVQDQVHAQAILDNEVTDPRTFGYVVGDKVRREVLLTLNVGYRLDEASLPEAGRLDRWLEIAAPEMQIESASDGRRYRIVLTYQLFNAPQAPETVTIPQQNLRIIDARVAGDGHALTTLVPALRITVAPLTSAVSVDRLHGAALQPDRWPAPLPVQARQSRLAWTVTALLVVLSFAAWRRGWMSFAARANLPFAQAVRELKQLPGAAGTPARDAAGLKIVHEALNRTAGRAVFAHNLDDFLAAHPEFAGLREQFDRLFLASSAVFFASGPAAATPSCSASQTLLHLCQACRRIERRVFRPGTASGASAAATSHVPGN